MVGCDFNRIFTPLLIPPLQGGKLENLVPSRHLLQVGHCPPNAVAPQYIRGGLGWGKKRLYTNYDFSNILLGLKP